MWSLLAQHDSGPGGLQQTIDTLARTPLSQIVIFVSLCSLVRVSLYGYLRNTVPHRRHGVYTAAKFVNEAMDAIVYAGVFVFMLIRPFAVQAFLIPSGSMLQTLWVNDFIVANKAIYRYTEPKFQDIIVFKPPQRALNKDQSPEEDFIKRCIGLPGDVVEVRGGRLYRNGKAVDEPYLSDSPAPPGADAEGNGHPIGTGAGTLMDVDWKLVLYEGRGRPDLVGQYIPVQINRSPDPGAPKCNYKINGACKDYAVGSKDDKDSPYSYVINWKDPVELSANEQQYARDLEEAPPAKVPQGFVLMMGDNRNHSYDGRAWGLVPRDDVIGRSEVIWLPIARWRVTR